MEGIWLLPVHLTGYYFNNSYALARIIVDIIFFLLILLPWARLTHNSNIGDKFQKITYGAHILLLYVIRTIKGKARLRSVAYRPLRPQMVLFEHC
jgi:hypothetical protein